MLSANCLCGHRLETGSFPNPGAFRAVSEQDLDEVEEACPGDELKRLILTSARIYECGSCGRFAIFWKGSHEPEFYHRD